MPVPSDPPVAVTPPAFRTWALDVSDTAQDHETRIDTLELEPAGIAVEDSGVQILANASRLDFTGAGVTVTDSGSGQATVAITAGSGALTQIGEVNLGAGAATISFSAIPATYRDLVITGIVRTNRAATTDPVAMRVGATTVDSGANYDWFLSNMAAGVAGSADLQGDTQARVTNASPATSATSGYFGTIKVEILRYADITQWRHIRSQGHSPVSPTDWRIEWNTGVWRNTAAAIDIVTLLPVTGTQFVTGTVLTLYGRS